jgi:sugar lactone lactonase YvrE
MRPEVALTLEAELGEGPAWDERSSRLLFVDILGHMLHSFDPERGEVDTLDLGVAVCAVAPRRRGGAVLAVEHGFALLDEGARVARRVATIDREDRPWRFNDGGCDPAGRFWAGTMTVDTVPGASALYRLSSDASVREILGDLTISNGMAWSADGGTMYFIDTPTQGVDHIDFDVASGTLGRRRRLVTVPTGAGSPDGMTIDADGCLWVALWGGSAVHRYTPEGKLDSVIELPVSNASSCAFGGAGLRTLFITTARVGLNDEEVAAQPHAGSLFAVATGSQGMPTLTFSG